MRVRVRVRLRGRVRVRVLSLVTHTLCAQKRGGTQRYRGTPWWKFLPVAGTDWAWSLAGFSPIELKRCADLCRI